MGNAKQNKLNVDQYAKFFFSSVFFKPEKIILYAIKRQHEPITDRFEVGRSIYLWQVTQRNQDEILLTWEFYTTKGSTWFCLPQNGNVIMFGSSIQIKKHF